MKIQSASLSDVGRVRRQNEDTVAILGEQRVYVVADGMGGHAGGKQASQTAVETLTAYLKNSADTAVSLSTGTGSAAVSRQDLVEAIVRANRRILELAVANSSLHGMGTTIAALVIEGESVGAIVHVGDSRVYRLRDDRFEQLTADHSLVADLVRRGEITEQEAQHHPYRHTLTRAVGAGAEVAPDVKPIDLRVGDVLVLCSDGIYGMIDERTLPTIVRDHQQDPDALCRALVDAANAGGGKDNASVIVVVCSPE